MPVSDKTRINVILLIRYFKKNARHQIERVRVNSKHEYTLPLTQVSSTLQYACEPLDLHSDLTG